MYSAPGASYEFHKQNKVGNAREVKRLFRAAVREKFYAELFEWLDDDMQLQRRGLDVRIHMRSGRTRTAELKMQSKRWGGQYFEVWSDVAGRRPGWMEKRLSADFLYWVVLPCRTVYRYDYPHLYRVWGEYGAKWKALAEKNRDVPPGTLGEHEFRFIRTFNEPRYGKPYESQGIVVPFLYLEPALEQSREEFMHRFPRADGTFPRRHR